MITRVDEEKAPMPQPDTFADDAIGVLTAQHREVEELWAAFQAAHATGELAQQTLAEEIVRRLSQHDALETQFLYPELRGSAGDAGRTWSDRSLDEHQRVRELLSQVDGRDVRDDDVYGVLADCVAAVLAHVAEEESEIFPLLRASSDARRLRDLARRMAEVEPMVPTRPHPSMPSGKVGATAAGAVAGLVDHARDALRDARRSGR